MEIMEQVLNAQTASTSAMEIEMTLVDSRGHESVRRIQTLMLEEDGRTKTVTVFLDPASVRNTRFLTVENTDRADDQWIYLPALRRIRRIASGEQDSSFMGSDFSYSDMSYGRERLDESDHEYSGNEVLDGRTCALVESTALPDSSSGYRRQVSWVDRQTWIPLRVEFYRSAGEGPAKVLTAADLEEVDGRWLARRLTMTTTQSGHRTELHITRARYGLPLAPGYFTTAFLETGRVQQ